MEVWPSILPAWQTNYSGQVNNAVLRTIFTGRTAQRQISRRNSELVNASLILQGTQLPLFEYFAQIILRQGQDKFTGKILNNGVVQDGPLRIAGGGYDVNAQSDRVWTVSCQIEAFR